MTKDLHGPYLFTDIQISYCRTLGYIFNFFIIHKLLLFKVAFLLQTIKSILRKAGYTVLRGDIRQQVKNNTSHLELPPHLLSNARVCTNRYEVLKYLPTGGTAVEVGVAYGDFSTHILNTLKPDLFITIDSFEITAGNEPWGRHTLQELHCSHHEYYTRQFSEPIQSGKMLVKKGLSWDMLEQLPDNSIDYIYVDADHSYDSVSKEIAILKSKVKPQAIIHFNDYTYFDQNALMPYGVPKAVHEFMLLEKYELLYLCLHSQGFYDVVLRKALT